MLLTNLFQNLREHAIASNSLNFAEEVIPFELLRSLRHLEFDEAGQDLKALLEKVYHDGISGLENVRMQGDEIRGTFLDKVTSALTKRYDFTIDNNTVKYKLLNPSEVDKADFSEIEFARTKLAGDTKKKKNCPNSTPCRYSCIPKSKQCSYTMSQDEKGEVTYIKQKLSGKKADIPNEDKGAIALKADKNKSSTNTSLATKNYKDFQGSKISVTNTEDGGIVFKHADGRVTTLDKDYVKEVAAAIKDTQETGIENSIDKFHSKDGERYIQAKIRPAGQNHSAYVDIRVGADTAKETGEKGVKIAYKTAQKIFSDK